MPETANRGRETPAAETVSTHLLQRFSGDETFRALLARLEERRDVSAWLRGLTGSSRSLLAAALARETGRPILLVTPDLSTAEDLKDDLLFLLGPRTAAVFPGSLAGAVPGAAPARRPAGGADRGAGGAGRSGVEGGAPGVRPAAGPGGAGGLAGGPGAAAGSASGPG